MRQRSMTRSIECEISPRMTLRTVIALLCLLLCQYSEGSISDRGGKYKSETGNARAEGSYTNVWAVGVYGGRKVADSVARRHGFQNHGQVSG